MDGWISQAQLLKTDIGDSKQLAADIKNHSKEAQRLQSEVKDAASKVDLLNDELSFNESLTRNLEQVYELQKNIKAVEDASFEDGLESPIRLLQVAREQLSVFRDVQDTRLNGLFEEKIGALAKLAEGAAIERWESCFETDAVGSSLTILSRSRGNPYLTIPTDSIFAKQTKEVLKRIWLLMSRYWGCVVFWTRK